MDKYEQLVELFKEKETAEKLLGMTTEEKQKYLITLGLDFSLEEIQSFEKGLLDSAKEGDELDIEDLDAVAGGGSYKQDCYNAGKKAGKILRQVLDIGLTILKLQK